MPASDDTTAAGQTGSDDSGLKVLPETERAFPEIIALIRQSQSMNDEERQYWVDILPVMTPEQVDQLRDILTNERDQLAAIDAKYAQELNKAGAPQAIRQMEEARRTKRAERSAKEEAARNEEEQKAEELLDALE